MRGWGAQDKEEVAHMVAAGGGGLAVSAVAARGRLRTGMWDGDADSEGSQRLVQLLSHFYTVDEGCGSCDCCDKSPTTTVYVN